MKKIFVLFCHILFILHAQGQIDYASSPKNMQLYPRDPMTNLGEVIFSGKVTESDVDSIVIRCLRTDGKEQLKSAFIDETNDNGFNVHFNIEAITENHHFSIFLRKNDVLQLVDSVKNVVAGDVYIIQGQSNAQAVMFNGDANVWQDSFVRSFGNPHPTQFNDANWYLAEGNRGFVAGSVGQIGMRLGRFLRDSLDIPIAIMNGAHGGRIIEFFQRNDQDPFDESTNYGRLLIRLRNAGLIDNIRSILFYQGESDGARAEIHKSLFEALYADWNEDLKPLESFYVMQVREGCGRPSLQLRDYQREFENYLPRLTSITANGVPSHDGCHYAFTGYTRIAQKVYYHIMRDIYDFPNPQRDIRPFRAWYSNDTNSEITFETDHKMDELTAEAGSGADFDISSGANFVTRVSATGNQLILTLNTGISDSLASLGYNGHAGDGRWILNQFGNGMFSFNEIRIDSFHPLINYDDPTIMSGSGNAINFDGLNDVILVNTSLNASYTKEAWIFPKQGGSANNIASSPGAAFWMPNGYAFKLSAGHNGVWNQVQDPVPMEFFRWTHVAVTYDQEQKTLKLYKNGMLVAENNNVPAHNGRGLSIGGYTDGYVFKGSIDEVKIWDHVRSLDEIRSDICQKLKGDEPGLQAYYRFDEIKGNIAPDATGKTIATLTNFDTTNQFQKAWIRSAVPLGTSSQYSYAPEDAISLILPSGQNLSLSNSSINGFVHLYFEEEKPNVITPPEDHVQVDSQLSFGIYFLGNEMSYDLRYDFKGNAFADSLPPGYVLNLLQRKNNAQPFWQAVKNTQFEPSSVKLSQNTPQEFTLAYKELITNTQNTLKSNPFVIFPNPAHDLCTIELANEIFNLQITDNLGHFILQKAKVKDRTTISTATFLPGSYLVQLRTMKGEMYEMQLIIAR